MLRDLFHLWKVARRRKESAIHYREFQSFQATLLIRHLEKHGVALSGQRLLDLGSGLGGYDQELAARGARVIALDLEHHRGGVPGIRRVTASAMAVPLRSESIDFVFCASLIEHVPVRGAVLSEIERVLRPGGFAYVSFPPYYSPLGGHEFAPFHYFGERFRTSKLRVHRDEARRMAVRAAKEKAQALAAELGVKVGAPVSIQEDDGGMVTAYQNFAQRTESPDAGGETLPSGRIEVRAGVKITFDLTTP